jgi:glycosyltransferase involved in cell wall biosynthesis
LGVQTTECIGPQKRRTSHSLTEKVSVIIPTYNRAAYIADAIRSVQSQDHPEVEIIVADDGSTDDTLAIVAGFGETLLYLPLAHGGLPAATRNRGLAKATGDFVAFLDSDDLFLPHKLRLQLSVFLAHPEAGLVYSDGYYFRDDPTQPTGRLLSGLPTPSGDVLPELIRGNFIMSPALLVRRSCLEEVGPFDEDPELRVSEDYELWLRVAARFPVFYAPDEVAAVRRHEGSISRDVASLRGCALLALAKLEDRYEDLRSSYGAALDEGYARNHGAIAMAYLRQGRILRGLKHAFHALRYSLRTPGLGTKALLGWLKRSRVRGTTAR